MIQSAWANTTLSDIAASITDSLDRNGRGGMLAPFENASGTEALPGITWSAIQNTGIYYFGTGDMRVSILAQDNFRWRVGGADIWNDGLSQWDPVLTGAAGNTTVPPGTVDLEILEWNQTGSVWAVAAPLVKVPAGTADNQIIEWNNSLTQWELGVQTGGGGVSPGTNDGNMLYWEDTSSAWLETFAIQVDSSGNILVSGTVDSRDINADGIAQDNHIADTGIHYTQSNIDHTQIQNIGTNNHSQIDSHIATTNIHFADAPSGSGIPYSRQDNGWVVAGSGGATFWDEVGVDLVPNNDGVVKGTFSDFGTKNAAAQMMTLSQIQYDGIGTKDIDTIYFII